MLATREQLHSSWNFVVRATSWARRRQPQARKALVAAMVAEQRGYDAGERNTRDLTDPANSQRRVDFVRREAASQQGRHAKRARP